MPYGSIDVFMLCCTGVYHKGIETRNVSTKFFKSIGFMKLKKGIQYNVCNYLKFPVLHSHLMALHLRRHRYRYAKDSIDGSEGSPIQVAVSTNRCGTRKPMDPIPQRIPHCSSYHNLGKAKSAYFFNKMSLFCIQKSSARHRQTQNSSEIERKIWGNEKV